MTQDLVRVELADGQATSVGRDYAERKGLKILVGVPAVGKDGRALVSSAYLSEGQLEQAQDAADDVAAAKRSAAAQKAAATRARKAKAAEKAAAQDQDPAPAGPQNDGSKGSD